MILTPVGLVVQSVVAAACAWAFGAAKGAIAYLVTCVGVGVLAVTFVPSVDKHLPVSIAVALTFGLPFVGAATGLGLAAGAMLRQRQRLIALALLSPTVLYWLGTTALAASRRTNGPASRSSSERTPPSGRPRARTRASIRACPGRRRMACPPDMNSPSVAPPRSSRSWMPPDPPLVPLEFSLACISTIPPGRRDPFKDACAQ